MSEPLTNEKQDIVQQLEHGMQEAREAMFQARRHVTHLRVLLKAAMEYVPDNHPWMPGMRDEVEKIDVA